MFESEHNPRKCAALFIAGAMFEVILLAKRLVFMRAYKTFKIL